MISGIDFLCYSVGVLILAVSVWIILYLIFAVSEWISGTQHTMTMKVNVIENKFR